MWGWLRISGAALVLGLLGVVLAPDALAIEMPRSLEHLLQKNPEALSGVPENAAFYAFRYYDENEEKLRNPDHITIVDYTTTSSAKRMHVFNMRTGDVEHFYAAHGKNSGLDIPTQFSNLDGSLQSSLGIYLTAEQYQGENGLSMRLDGMEPSNSNARSRTIVFHSADYVSEDWIRRTGRLGRSWGCVVVEQKYIEGLVAKLEGGSVLYVHGNHR